MKRFRSLVEAVVRVVYPDRCVCCGRILGEGELCGGCEALIRHIPDNCCPGCGLPAQSCECGARPPATDGFAAPFYNRGRAKRGVYRMKFQGSERTAEFFGSAMAECFERRFAGVKPDAVCFVPTGRASKRRRGFSHAERLANAAAKRLKIPVERDALVRVRSCRPQHTLSRDKRTKNVQGAFAADRSVKGRTILLIDDIKTTGATVNECARTLKAAGAAAVYGLCAVRSENAF